MDKNLDIFRIKTNNVEPKKGRILIAEPFLTGSYFNRSIVFLVEHNTEGSVGFILNKPVDFPVPDFKKQMPKFNDILHMGGPVNIESVYYLHTLGDLIPNSVQIVDNLYWGGDYDCLKQMIDSGSIDGTQVRFFLGYSGWGEGQLHEEIGEDSWLVADIHPDTVMQSSPKLWNKMVKKQGGIYSIWENYPENPSMN